MIKHQYYCYKYPITYILLYILRRERTEQTNEKRDSLPPKPIPPHTERWCGNNGLVSTNPRDLHENTKIPTQIHQTFMNGQTEETHTKID